MSRGVRRTAFAVTALVVSLVVAPDLDAATVDLGRLALQETHARVLTEELPLFEVLCPGGGECIKDASPFSPESLVVRCPTPGCVIQLEFCLDYTLTFLGPFAFGAVILRVDAAPPTPTSVFGLSTTALDVNHNRACVTAFATGLARGPHTVEGLVGVDNVGTNQEVKITVRSATLVIRVYR